MKAGPLDRLIDIERSTVVLDAAGQPIETWAKLVLNKPAAYKPISGVERYTGEQFAASEQIEFTVRWSADLATLNPRDRVIYPAGSVEGSPPVPPEECIYDIMAAPEIGRREGIRIMTVRRSERRTEV